MSTSVDIDKKKEGDLLTHSEFNAIVTAINENSVSLDQSWEQIKGKLSGSKISVGGEIISIDSVEDLLNYINQYGTGTDKTNTPPIIRIKQTTYIYKEGDQLTLDLDIFDAEGGELILTGNNPEISGGFNSFRVEKLRSGVNTVDLNQLVYQNTTSKLPIGSYIFSNIYVIDKLGRSSVTPINIKIVIGSIELKSLFDSEIQYKKGTPIVVRYSLSSITNTHDITFRTTGKMLIEDEDGNLNYQNFTGKTEVLEGLRLVDNDGDLEVGQPYSLTYIIADGFANMGDYTLQIDAIGKGDGFESESNSLKIGIIVNEAGVLMISSSLDPNGNYFTGDTLDVPINLYYTEDTSKLYMYKCYAEIQGLGIIGESLDSEYQKNIVIKLPLPDEYGEYTINYWAEILSPTSEVYKTKSNYTVISLKNKSSYFVTTSPESKLELALSGKGKTNNSPNWATWENKYNLDQKYFGDLRGFITSINGWEERDGTNQHTGESLKFSSEAHVLVNYNVFESISQNANGITVEFSIKTGALNSANNYNLSIGNPNQYPKRGIYVVNNELIVEGLTSTISVPIISDKSVLTKMGEWEPGEDFAICAITYNTKTNEVFVYVNGIITGYSTFADASLLTHTHPIYINAALNNQGLISGFSDTKIRYIRVYQTCLTHEQILGNFIASYPDDTERLLLEDLNDLQNPVISSAYIQGDRITGVDKDVPKLLIMNFTSGQESRITDTYIPNPIADGIYGQEWMDMKKEFPVDLDFQGNSSLSYPVKNYGIDIYDGSAWENNKVLNSKKYFMVENVDRVESYKPWVSWDSFHLKSNYIDSSHCNNVVMAKLAESLCRFPYNWGQETYLNIFKTAQPFINYTTVREDGSINSFSRFPVEPNRLAIDGFPFVLYGDYKDSNNSEFKRRFIGLYTWNLKQHRNLYSMKSDSSDPNRKYFIYRCESNGDSVHEQLRSGYCKMFDMSKETLYLDSFGRVLLPSYIAAKENQEMFGRYNANDYPWTIINSEVGFSQKNGKYTWIKFGNDYNDYSMRDNPENMTFIGLAFDQDSNIKSSDPLDYTWYNANVNDPIPYKNNFNLIRYSTSEYGNDMGSSLSGKTHIGIIMDVSKKYWVEGVDYFDKTQDPEEMSWRLGAEMIMDWEARNPKDLGRGHWEEQVNGNWVTTYDIIDPADLDHTSTKRKTLRWKWDDYSNGKAIRSGHTPIDYWTSITDPTTKIPSLNDPSITFDSIDKKKAKEATEQHVDFINACHWLHNASDECFMNPAIFNKYFELQTCLDYVISCITFCLTDSVGRNFGFISWDDQFCPMPDANGVMYKERMRWYPVFYDMDTAFGTNVQGGLYSTPYIEWPYDIMYKDTDGSWKYIYKASSTAGQEYNNFNSSFFKRISKCYGKALQRRYQELRGGTNDPNDQTSQLTGVFNYLDIIKMYNKQVVGRVGERYFNEDAIYKYIGGFQNDPDKIDKLTYYRNARGNKVMFIKNFLNKRLDYIDGLFAYIPDTEDMAYIQTYYQGTLELEIETAIAGNIRISTAQNSITQIYCDGLNPTKFQVTYPEVTQHILRIYNCGIITKLRGLSGKDVRIARLNSMTSLQELDLSNNKNFGMELSTVEISNCNNLRTINLSNCNGDNTFNFDISNCQLLEDFNIRNSTISDISFFKNPNLKRIDVQNCPNFRTLDLSNLTLLRELFFDLDNIISLNISNCSMPFDFSIKNSFNNLESLVITNNNYVTSIKFDNTSFLNLKELNIYNCPQLSSAVELLKNRNSGALTLNTNFLGKCPKLKDISGLFEGSNVATFPQNFLYESHGVTTIDNIFKDCKNLNIIPSIFDQMDSLESAMGAFQNCVLQKYETVYGEDEWGDPIEIGKKSTPIYGANFLSKFPQLRYIDNIFKGAEISKLPVKFLEESNLIRSAVEAFADITNPLSDFKGAREYLKLNDILFNHATLRLNNATEMFKGSLIESIPQDMLSYATYLNNIKGLFKDAHIKGSIPNSFLLNSEITDLSEIFYNAKVDGYIGEDFLSKTINAEMSQMLFNFTCEEIKHGFLKNLKVINGFEEMTEGFNVKHIGNEAFLNVENLISLYGEKYLFSNIQDLEYVGDGFLQSLKELKDFKILYNCPKLTSLPKGYLSNVNDLKKPKMYDMFGSTPITTINEDLLKSCKVLEDMSEFFDNTAVSKIPDLFMSYGYPELKNVHGMFNGTNKLLNIPSLLFKNCPNLNSMILFKDIDDIRTITIEEGWLSWNNNIQTLYWSNDEDVISKEIDKSPFYVNTDFKNITFVFKGDNILSNLPVCSLFSLGGNTLKLPNNILLDSPNVKYLGLISKNNDKFISLPHKLKNYKHLEIVTIATQEITKDVLTESSNIDLLNISTELINDNSFENFNGSVIKLGTYNDNSNMEIGNDVFKTVPSLVSLLLETSNVFSIGSNFMQNAVILEDLSGLANKLSNLTVLNSGFLENAPIKTYQDLLKGNNILQGSLPSGFFKNFQGNVFKWESLTDNDKITEINEDFLQNNNTIEVLDGTFNGSQIVEIPIDFMPNNTIVNKLVNWGSSNITTINKGFLNNAVNIDISEWFVSGSLKTVDVDIFRNSGITGFYKAFYGCSNLHDFPDFWKHYPEPDESNLCFRECGKDGNYDYLPSNWGGWNSIYVKVETEKVPTNPSLESEDILFISEITKNKLYKIRSNETKECSLVFKADNYYDYQLNYDTRNAFETYSIFPTFAPSVIINMQNTGGYEARHNFFNTVKPRYRIEDSDDWIVSPTKGTIVINKLQPGFYQIEYDYVYPTNDSVEDCNRKFVGYSLIEVKSGQETDSVYDVYTHARINTGHNIVNTQTIPWAHDTHLEPEYDPENIVFVVATHDIRDDVNNSFIVSSTTEDYYIVVDKKITIPAKGSGEQEYVLSDYMGEDGNIRWHSYLIEIYNCKDVTYIPYVRTLYSVGNSKISGVNCAYAGKHSHRNYSTMPAIVQGTYPSIYHPDVFDHFGSKITTRLAMGTDNVHIPKGVFKTFTNCSNFNTLFGAWSWSTGTLFIPEDLFKYGPKNTSYKISRQFSPGANQLVYIPKNLFNYLPIGYNHELTNMFSVNTNNVFIGKIPSIWEKHKNYISTSFSSGAFNGLSKATNWAEVPDTWGGPLITNSNVSLMDYNALLSRVEAIEALTYVAPKEEVLVGEEDINETPKSIETE